MNIKKVFFGIVLIELIVSVGLGIKIYSNKSNVLGASKINPIDRNTIQYPKESKLEQYYEPSVNLKYSSTMYGYTGAYTLNKDALNERYDYFVEKNNKTFRVITMGDSFTFGVYVNTKDNWTEQLEEMLNSKKICNDYDRIEVINIGVGGYDIEFALERFKLRGKKYNPDLVVWLLKGDDLWQVNKLIQPVSNKYTDEMKESGELEISIKKGNPYPGWSKAFKEFMDNSDINEIKSIQEKHLNEFETIYNNEILYAMLPYASTPKEEKELIDLLESQTEKNKLTNLQILPNIYTSSKFYIKNDGHPTKDGYRIIASAIYDHILKTKLICN